MKNVSYEFKINAIIHQYSVMVLINPSNNGNMSKSLDWITADQEKLNCVFSFLFILLTGSNSIEQYAASII